MSWSCSMAPSACRAFSGSFPRSSGIRRFVTLLVAAALCYGAHTGIDIAIEPPTALTVVVEESAKLFCSTFTALGFFVGFVGAVQSPAAVDASGRTSRNDTPRPS